MKTIKKSSIYKKNSISVLKERENAITFAMDTIKRKIFSQKIK